MPQYPAAQSGLEFDNQTHSSTTGVPELDGFADRGLITRVHTTLTSGKEGTVYCCRAHPSLNRKFVAAKVYREHAESSYKWNPTYFQGRERVLKAQVLRAIQARSEFGKDVAAGLWIAAEYESLKKMASCGISVPEPLAMSQHAILMDYIGNGAGPAPHLDSLCVGSETAHSVCEHILHDIERMLANDLVHGDLSPYNILLWKDQPWIIDVPQAVDARFNDSAFELLSRDIQRVCTFFEQHGIRHDARRLAIDLWTRYQRAEL